MQLEIFLFVTFIAHVVAKQKNFGARVLVVNYVQKGEAIFSDLADLISSAQLVTDHHVRLTK